ERRTLSVADQAAIHAEHDALDQVASDGCAEPVRAVLVRGTAHDRPAAASGSLAGRALVGATACAVTRRAATRRAATRRAAACAVTRRAVARPGSGRA